MPRIPTTDVGGLVKHLESMLSSSRSTIRRDALACLLGLHGLRINEVCQLRTDEWDGDRDSMRIRTLKGGPTSWIPVRHELHDAMQRQVIESQALPSEFIFCTSKGKQLDDRNLYKRWSTWSAHILGQSYRFHDLRHATAHVMDEHGASIIDVQLLLRHSSIQSTLIYLPNRQAKLRAWLPSPERGTDDDTRT